MYNEGISHSSLLVDLGIEHGIVDKSGSWLSYGDLRLGQGKENSRLFLIENQDIADEIDIRVRAALGVEVEEKQPRDGQEASLESTAD